MQIYLHSYLPKTCICNCRLQKDKDSLFYCITEGKSVIPFGNIPEVSVRVKIVDYLNINEIISSIVMTGHDKK